MLLIDRINTLKDTEKSVRAFAAKLGLPQPSVNYYIKGERKISYEFIEAIADAYPELSMEWLIRGEGEMYLEKTSSIPDTPSVGEEYYNELLAQMKSMQQKITNLENKVG